MLVNYPIFLLPKRIITSATRFRVTYILLVRSTDLIRYVPNPNVLRYALTGNKNPMFNEGEPAITLPRNT